MNQQFKEWAIKNMEQMELEDRQKILLMVKNEPDRALTFIRGCIRDWFILFSLETKASEVVKLDVSNDSGELLQAFRDYFARKIATATQ